MARRRTSPAQIRPETSSGVAIHPEASGKERFFNRESSWLEFNRRVLEEALDPSVPLLERVKFMGITHTNLDEFFEVRVAGLKQQIESESAERTPDGLSAGECLREVTRRVRALVQEADRCWSRDLAPALEARGFRFLRPDALA